MEKGNLEYSMVSDLRNGSVEAYAGVFKLYYCNLYNFANRLLQNESDAEDVVLNVFTQFQQIQQEFADLPQLQLWLYQATRNACLIFIRDNNFHPDKKTAIRHTSH